MSTAAVVSVLVALVCLIVFFVMETRPKKTVVSMLDLAEFKDLPGELRTIIRGMMPKPALLKKQWASMTPQHKQMVIQNMMQQFPNPGGSRDHVPSAPAPAVKVKHEPAKPEIEEVPKESGLKQGFLLANSVNKRQKKNTKNKKEDKVVTLSDVGASDDESSGPVAVTGSDDD